MHRLWSPSQPIKPADSASRESIDDDDTLNTTVEEDVDLENRSTVPPPPIEEEVAQCCICHDNFLQPTMHYCAGTQGRHYLCRDCDREYLRAELALGRAFAGTKHMGGNRDSTVVSVPGELPCPAFLDPDNLCDCASLPWVGLLPVLSDNPDIADLFSQALRRVIEAQVRQEIQSENINSPTPSTPQGNSGNVLDVHRRVTNYLNYASMMRCPSCGLPGFKNEACMHIDCDGDACSTNWCYCCGRHRRRNGNPEDCRGCDVINGNLQNNPSWGNFAMGDEHPGTGARIEFHRRIMRYYIQRIRHETSSELWDAFQQAYPNILSGVPVRGRSISWEELNSPSARIPPLFGNSTEADLLWRLPLLAEDPRGDSDNELTDDVQSGGDNQRTDNRTNRAFEDLPPISKQVFHSQRGHFWLATCAFTIVLILVNRVALDDVSPALKAVTTLMVAFLVYGVVAFGLLRLADYSALHTCRGGRQFFVSPEDDELPFLSQVGRWSSHQDTYVRFFVGGLALGSWMVGSSDNMGSLGGTSRLIGTTMLTLVITIFCCLSLLVNRSRPPQNREDGLVFQRLFLILIVCSILWAFGIGFCMFGLKDVVYHIGTVMLSLGLAGLVGEMTPRLIRDDGHPIWGDIDGFRLMISYLFCGSLALGPTFIRIGYFSDILALRIIGILLLSAGLPVAIILGCCQTDNS